MKMPEKSKKQLIIFGLLFLFIIIGLIYIVSEKKKNVKDENLQSTNKPLFLPEKTKEPLKETNIIEPKIKNKQKIVADYTIKNQQKEQILPNEIEKSLTVETILEPKPDEFLASSLSTKEEIKNIDEMVNATGIKKTTVEETPTMRGEFTVSDADLGLRLHKALLFAEQGDTSKALAELDEITKLNKRYIDAWNELARLSLSKGDKKSAIKALKRLSSIVTAEKFQDNINEIIKLSQKDNYKGALAKLTKLKYEKQY